MGKSPKLAQMIFPTPPVPKLLHDCLLSEFAGLEKSILLQGGQSEGIKYKLFAGTWNVGGVAPPDDLDLMDWLDTKAGSRCDIYVLGFQEIVPLNVRNVLGPKKRSAAMKWGSLIGDVLNNRRRSQGGKEGGGQEECGEEAQPPQWHQDQDTFRCVMRKQMVGIFVSVWARSGLCRLVHHPGASCVGAGFLGFLGNKGAVTVRFMLQATSFCFVCCHLASGSNVAPRNADAAAVLSRTRFHGRCRVQASSPRQNLPRRILDHDRVVLLGDLNYRVAMDAAEARQMARASKWGMLLENDQLLLELSEGRRFDGWLEGLMTFAPTYKYHRNSDQFCWGTDDGADGAQQKRHRAPAWCDRILWRWKGMSQTLYESCGGYRISDHRPVRAVFHAVGDVVEGVDINIVKQADIYSVL